MERLPVYLVHWNAPDWCRRSVASITASEGVDVQVVVVDNGSVDEGRVADALPPGTTVLEQDANRGYAGGANAALDHWHEHHPDAELAVIPAAGHLPSMEQPDVTAAVVRRFLSGKRP